MRYDWAREGYARGMPEPGSACGCCWLQPACAGPKRTTVNLGSLDSTDFSSNLSLESASALGCGHVSLYRVEFPAPSPTTAKRRRNSSGMLLGGLLGKKIKTGHKNISFPYIYL